jgi:hypothetical protein
MSLALSSYSREQLSSVLRILKLYKNGLVQIGRRAHLQDPKEPAVVRVRVEYPSTANRSDIEKFVQGQLSPLFGITDIPSDIVFIESSSLVGGVRIFAGDDMVDISFQRFANQIKN